MDDKRSGAVRFKTGYALKLSSYKGKWKRRFVVLTPEALHWFKRPEGYDLFGEERGHAKMTEILGVTIPADDPSCFELLTSDNMRRLFKVDSAHQAEEWTKAVEDSAKSYSCIPSSKRPDVLAALKFTDEDVAPVADAEVSIALVSTIKGKTNQEAVVARDVKYSHLLALPAFGAGDKLLITTTNGAVAMLTEEELREHHDGTEFECQLDGTQPAVLIMRATCDDTVEEVPRLRSFINLLMLDRHTTAMLIIAYMTLLSCCSFLLSTSMEFFSTLVFAGSLSTYAVLFITQRLRGLRVLREYVISIERYEVLEVSSQDGSTQSEEIPERFINGCMGDMREAKRRWEITKKWRKDENIDHILQEEQPYYDIIKQYYPHFFCGRGHHNQPVYYERPGQVDMAKLKEAGVTVDALLRHYIFMTEYMWNVLEKDDLQRSITVFDVAGVGLGDLVGEAVDFMKKAIKIVQEHYPERSYAICIINAPGWFSMIWNIVKPMVNQVTQEKIRILKNSEILDGLSSLIPVDQIPKRYGGTLVCGDGGPDSERFQSPEEIAMREFAHNIGKRQQEDRLRSMDSDSELSTNASSNDLTAAQAKRPASTDLRRRAVAGAQEDVRRRSIGSTQAGSRAGSL